VADSRVDNWARELVRLLGEMTRLHEELAGLMRGKLDAIRRADSDAIQAITSRELLLANRVAEREGLRRDLVRNLLRDLGLNRQQTAPVRITELAEHFAEPQRSQILGAAAGLRSRIEEIDRMRISTRLITEQMLGHMGEILAVMTSGGAATGVYSRGGGRETSGRANVFEAVG
jgi:hypothetical protein